MLLIANGVYNPRHWVLQFFVLIHLDLGFWVLICSPHTQHLGLICMLTDMCSSKLHRFQNLQGSFFFPCLKEKEFLDVFIYMSLPRCQVVSSPHPRACWKFFEPATPSLPSRSLPPHTSPSPSPPHPHLPKIIILYGHSLEMLWNAPQYCWHVHKNSQTCITSLKRVSVTSVRNDKSIIGVYMWHQTKIWCSILSSMQTIVNGML